MKTVQLPFRLFAIGLLLLLIVPVLIQDGMFMDGQQYAIISKNLAEGKGTFWKPYLGATWFKEGSPWFLEHPPLVYAIQSVFFKVLGDSMYVERIYSLCCALACAWIIAKVWKQIPHSNPDRKSLTWLPVIFWILIPTSFWVAQNDMMENTMWLFTTAAAYFFLVGLREDSAPWGWTGIAGICVFLATFCKGVPGLFPLGIPFIYWISTRSYSIWRAIVYTLIITAVPAVCYGLLMLDDQARNSLVFYVKSRLLERINNAPTVSNRYSILGQLGIELLPGLALLGLLWALLRKQQSRPDTGQVLFFGLMGLAGSAPLILTPVQRPFYYAPALPFFGIALALAIAPAVLRSMEYLEGRLQLRKYLANAAWAFLAFVLVFSCLHFGKVGKDRELLADVYEIGPKIPANSTIAGEPALYDNWQLQFYLLRHYNISIDPGSTPHEYLLKQNGSGWVEGEPYGEELFRSPRFILLKKKDQ